MNISKLTFSALILTFSFSLSLLASLPAEAHDEGAVDAFFYVIPGGVENGCERFVTAPEEASIARYKIVDSTQEQTIPESLSTDLNQQEMTSDLKQEGTEKATTAPMGFVYSLD